MKVNKSKVIADVFLNLEKIDIFIYQNTKNALKKIANYQNERGTQPPTYQYEPLRIFTTASNV